MRRAAGLAVATLALVAATAHAAPVAPPAVKSANVTWHATLDEPAVISARFKDTTMFVSTLRGLSVYDVADPRAPRKIGSLDLPHFENEDVDLAGNILLISNDPSEGAGRLYTIDISDPARPAILGSVDTGIAEVGQTVILRFLGQDPGPLQGGTGHTASCIDECRFAYLAGTAAGIDIYDLTDPRNPRKAGNAPVPEVAAGVATHDVQVDRSGLAWIAGFGGTAGYDVSNPLKPRLVHRTDDSAKSTYLDELGLGDGSGLNDFVHHNSARLAWSSLPGRAPEGADPAGDSDVVLITEEDYTRPGCRGAGSFQSWGIGADGELHNLDQWSVEPDPTKGRVFCSAHYFDERDGLVAQGWYEQGTRFLDVSDPMDIRQVGYWIPDGTETWGALYPPTDPSGRVAYALDTARGIDVIEIDRPNATRTLPPPPQGLDRIRPTGDRFAAMLRAAGNRAMGTQRAPRTRRMQRTQGRRPAFAGLCRLNYL